MAAVTACDCGGEGLGVDGFHYEGAEGCLRPIAAPSAVDETVKRRVALPRADGASGEDAVTGALRSLTRAERAEWLSETPEELQKGDDWLREAAIRARDRMWARLVLAERSARAEERTGATVALRNFGVDVDASIVAAASATARTCAHEKVYSGERHPTGAPQWFWICAKCHGTGADSLATPATVDFDAFVALLGHVDLMGAENMRRMRGAMKKNDDVGVALRATLALLSLLGFGAQAKPTDPADAMGWSVFREGQGDPEYVGSRMRLRQLVRRAIAIADARKRFCESCACNRQAQKVDAEALGPGSDDNIPAEPGEPPSDSLGDRT